MKKQNSLPPLEYLKECFSIDLNCLTGLRWKNRPRSHFKTERQWKQTNKQRAEKPAGRLRNCNFYGEVKVDGVLYGTHRIIYSIYYEDEEIMDLFIDHIDGNNRNNSPENLRKVNCLQSARNKNTKPLSKSGFRGVSKVKNKFMCSIGYKNKTIRLGSYLTKEQAAYAFNVASKLVYKEYGGYLNPVETPFNYLDIINIVTKKLIDKLDININN